MNKNYIHEWKNKIISMEKALTDNNFNSYDILVTDLNNIYENYKKDISLTYECLNFGMANYIFEDKLPELFINNKNIVKEYIKTVKGDKNLLYQAQLYNVLSQYDGTCDVKRYVDEAFDLTMSNIDRKSLLESNKKIFNLIKKYNIKPNDLISEDKLAYFNSCNYILSKDKKLSNMKDINDNVVSICEFVKSNAEKTLNENKVNIYKLVDDFESKLNKNLNESETKLIKAIIEGKTTDELQTMFNDIKQDCIEQINLMEKNEGKSEELQQIKEDIQNKTLQKDTMLEDVIKLLEVQEVLSE